MPDSIKDRAAPVAGDMEADRLNRLRAYEILDTPPEESFDRLTRLAASLLDMPMSAVSLIDADRQWFKSRVGLEVAETPRKISFCDHTMHEHEVMEVPDATADPRFADNPLVTGDFHLRYYAGAPLRSPDGQPLGSLCVIDRRPRRMTAEQRLVLSDLAAMAVDAMELRSVLRSATAREDATRQAKAALEASEKRQRAILETAADAILTIDARGIIQSVNPATTTLLGYTEAEMAGRNVSMLMPEPHASAHDGYMGRYHGTNTPHIIGIGREVPARRKDGTLFPAELAVSEMRIDGDRYYTGILRDISRRREAEDALRERNRLLGLAEEVAQVGHWRLEKGADTVTWSDGMYRIFGRTPEDFTPTVDSVLACSPEEERETIRAVTRAAIRERTGYAIDHSVVMPDGSVRTVCSTGRCELDEGGRVAALFGVVQDITERKQAADELRASEERLQRATEFADIGTWDVDLANHELYWSARVAGLFGLPEGERRIPYETFLQTIHPDDLDMLRAAVAACIEHGAPYNVEHRVVWPDGSIRWLHEQGDVVRDGAGKALHMLGVVRDITRAKAAELALKESQQRLEVAINHISDGFVLMDANDRIVVWNDKMLQLYPRIAPFIYPGVGFEDAVRRGVADGQYVDAVGREEEFIAERLARHRLAEENSEERLIDAHGEERTVRVAERRIPGGGRVGVRVDITELRRAQEEADAANRAKSEFLSSMSHELRTPLNAILGFAQLLEASRKEPLSERQKSHVRHILKGGQHLLDLINEVLDLARIEAGKMTLSIEDISSEDVLGSCLPIAETLAEQRGITVRTEAPCGGPMVRADFTRFKQVLLNLLSNAVKYNRDGGTVTVRIGSGAPGMARFTVIDTGKGIPPARMKDLFQPFNRLGAEATDVEGTGIGLTLTRELVERMDGTIGVSSQQGVGTTFWFDLPLAEGKFSDRCGEDEAAQPSPPAEPGPALRMLYVEDNPANMRLMEEVVEDLRHIDLLTAHTAELGLEMAAAERPDLIILDINLPGMDGMDAVRRLRRMPGLTEVPVIALSANATASSIQKGLAAGFDAYLTKPVVIPDLINAIESATKEKAAQ